MAETKAAAAPGEIQLERLKRRRNNAKREYDAFQPMREEAYRYAIPYRKSTRDTGQGEKRVDQAFDHTAIAAAFQFAGNLQQDIWPAEQNNFAIEPGPLVQGEAERKALADQLAPISKIIGAYFDDPDWGMSFHEMAIDLSAGTGAMLLNPSDEQGKLWEPISVPVEELLLEAGANGKISGVFWDRKMPVRVLQETYPEGKFDDKLQELLKKNPEKEINVHHDTIRVKRNGVFRWHIVVWCDEQKSGHVHTAESRTSPWLLPRYFRVAGETFGRGLVMLAMPTIKTVNTAARLQLQAAAIAMLGIYTAIDDGVFNPDLSPIQPGAFWKVGSNGGNRGRTVEKFADPRLDLNQLVLQDLRQGVRSTMMDDDLPMADEAVKSPTEIIERIKKANSRHMGAFERLVKEIVIPAVMRVIELAYNAGLIQTPLTIDSLLLRIRINSPLAVARAAARVQRNLEWLQMVIMTEQSRAALPQIDRIVNADDMLVDAGRNLGVDERFIANAEQRAAADKRVAALQQMQALGAGGAQ